MARYESWGRYPRAGEQRTVRIDWRHEPPALDGLAPVLPRGMGRSYGDVCLNDGGTLLLTRGLSGMIELDRAAGLLTVEAGATLGEVLPVLLESGWILRAIPGTKHVTIGGCIANDVHGKDHEREGSFGCHVESMEILRSDRGLVRCSRDEETELFEATIGGLGLTGVILSATLRLRPISSQAVQARRQSFDGWNGFFDSLEAGADDDYSVSWIDASSRGIDPPRGFHLRGSHLPDGRGAGGSRALPAIPMPPVPMTRATIRLACAAYYALQSRRGVTEESFESFFFPLDRITGWNRAYGRRGFLQYQCVIPPAAGRAPVIEILRRIASSATGSPLTIAKRFGPRPSLGLLSFPVEGTTIASDLPASRENLSLLDDLDVIVRRAEGRVYPAKDARMSGENFRTFYPRAAEFQRFIDPRFSSSFWRRVME
ncbi:MAG TPA: FAD-binding oxidoreductase [Thermoanaerobaculia bacterium]|nr:FAD-binding oxidoreductase [Thermoanaerobaculia bacterium]